MVRVTVYVEGAVAAGWQQIVVEGFLSFFERPDWKVICLASSPTEAEAMLSLAFVLQ